MGFADYLLLIGIALLLSLSVFLTVRGRRRGGCSGCCAECAKRGNCKKS